MDPNWWRLYPRLSVEYEPHRPESTFQGTTLCTLRHYFKQDRQWLIVPEALLRDIIVEEQGRPMSGPSHRMLPTRLCQGTGGEEGELGGGKDGQASDESQDGGSEEGESEEDEDGDESDESDRSDDDGEGQEAMDLDRIGTKDDEIMEEVQRNATQTFEDDFMENSDEQEGECNPGPKNAPLMDQSRDSQGLKTSEKRAKASRPDFAVSHFRGALFHNHTHLYVEVKNGSQPRTAYEKQLKKYIGRIGNAIPPELLKVHKDVVLMLIDAGKTFYWRITPQNAEHASSLWDWAHSDVTLGAKMSAVLKKLSQRPIVPLGSS